MEPASQVVETHISRVFFTPDRVYKFFKPVRFAFLDHTSVDARAEGIDREMELNRLFAPDVYLGRGEVREGGVVTDHFLVMRRLPDDRRLATLVAAGDASDHIRSVARAIASIHATATANDAAAEVASPESERSRWDHNIDELADLRGVLPDEDVRRVANLAHRYLEGRTDLLEDRIDRGLAREGHGDLLAEDIFCLDDGPRILDCLAFDETLRLGDVLADIAFLAMDLERIGGPAEARTLLDAYCEFSNEHHPDSLAHHYIAYRALVRAKIAALRATDGNKPGDIDQAMVVVGGTPGTGKTTIADAIGAERDWIVLSTDELRKDLAGVGHEEHAFADPGGGIYDDASRSRTYDELVSRVTKLARMGESVVLDGSWTRDVWRDLARRAARDAGAELLEVRCTAPRPVAHERIARRLSAIWDPSDATAEVADALVSEDEPWPAALELDTTRPVTECVARVSDALDAS
jgi:aminoglycoside phosphotransferase family enzyme/gluconate kinase